MKLDLGLYDQVLLAQCYSGHLHRYTDKKTIAEGHNYLNEEERQSGMPFGKGLLEKGKKKKMKRKSTNRKREEERKRGEND